ncbi:MAG: trypsin-like peptidase domain-containing protein [Candidatus Bipolaricaulota bacterium]|nr:trypsin-like peptidase domain-containing protein [Candidatus Bipolaricaulota bacterium]
MKNKTRNVVALAVVVSLLSSVALATQAEAVGSEDQVIAVYGQCSPSVVNITSLANVYNWFSGNVQEEGTGSGFVYDDQGHIITNYHVVQGADELIVKLSTGEEYTATVVGMDSSNDLAVLQIDAGSSLPAPLPLADSDALRVGQTVLAIGSPYGLQQTLTTGVVSALGRVIESPEANQFIGEVIQTDAAINPGNSGGPLLDLEGRVIGVNSQILSPSGSSSGIGFAISASTIQRVVPQLITYGSYQHAWLGIETINLNQNTTQILRQAGADLTVEEGVLIVSFDDGSPAKAAGLHAGSHQTRIGPYLIPLGGDVIVAVDGAPVKTMADLTVYLEMETAVGQTVRVTVVRNGSQLEIPVELAARPA